MGIVIKDNLFYIHTKDSSLIIEERDGDLLLKHLGKKLKPIIFPILFLKRIMLFQLIQWRTIEIIVMIHKDKYLVFMVLVILECLH